MDAKSPMQFYFVFQECPSGIVNEDTFKDIYAQFFPQGGSCHVSLLLCFCCFLSPLSDGLSQIAFHCLEKLHQLYKVKPFTIQKYEGERWRGSYAGWRCSLFALIIMQRLYPRNKRENISRL